MRNTAAAVVLCSVVAASQAQVAVLTPTKDNTIIRDLNNASVARSNALGIQTFAGRTAFNAAYVQRTLYKFDIAGAVPAGATVTDVTLTLQMTLSGGATTAPLKLHRLLADWGEGTSSAFGGSGAPSTTGDASWAYRFFPTVLWAAAGGDFVSTPTTALTTTIGSGTVVLPTSSAFVDDVQAIVDGTEADFGWMLRNDETTLGSARAFSSREEPSVAARPTLRLSFTPPCPSDINRDRSVDFGDFLAFFNCFDQELPCGDIDENPGVDFGDFLAFFNGYDAGC